MQQSVEFVLQYLLQHGPFDGLMGFSQGAAMVTRVAMIVAEQHCAVLPSLRFLILIGGVQPLETRFTFLKVTGAHKRELPLSILTKLFLQILLDIILMIIMLSDFVSSYIYTYALQLFGRSRSLLYVLQTCSMYVYLYTLYRTY